MSLGIIEFKNVLRRISERFDLYYLFCFIGVLVFQILSDWKEPKPQELRLKRTSLGVSLCKAKSENPQIP